MAMHRQITKSGGQVLGNEAKMTPVKMADEVCEHQATERDIDIIKK